MLYVLVRGRAQNASIERSASVVVNCIYGSVGKDGDPMDGMVLVDWHDQLTPIGIYYQRLSISITGEIVELRVGYSRADGFCCIWYDGKMAGRGWNRDVQINCGGIRLSSAGGYGVHHDSYQYRNGSVYHWVILEWGSYMARYYTPNLELVAFGGSDGKPRLSS